MEPSTQPESLYGILRSAAAWLQQRASFFVQHRHVQRFHVLLPWQRSSLTRGIAARLSGVGPVEQSSYGHKLVRRELLLEHLLVEELVVLGVRFPPLNSSSSINVLTEREQVMPPQSGFHLSFCANYTLDGVKATAAISVDSQTGALCAGWDRATANDQ